VKVVVGNVTVETVEVDVLGTLVVMVVKDWKVVVSTVEVVAVEVIVVGTLVVIAVNSVEVEVGETSVIVDVDTCVEGVVMAVN
jgi:hypothetical protein